MWCQDLAGWCGIGTSVMVHTFFEEESDLIATLEEIAVADMIALLARGELGHGMIVQREVIEHAI